MSDAIHREHGPISDTRIRVARFQRGDEAAGHWFVSRYWRRLVGFCARKLNNSADADDAAMSVVRRVKELPYTPNNFVAYLFEVARNVCATTRRQERRRSA